MQSRYESGLGRLSEIDRALVERVLASLRGIALNFARYLVEFVFGDIYARAGLDPKSRQVATAQQAFGMTRLVSAEFMNRRLK